MVTLSANWVRGDFSDKRGHTFRTLLNKASLKSQNGRKGEVRALPGPWGEFPAFLRWEEGAERPWR